jgi:hypothetical protein
MLRVPKSFYLSLKTANVCMLPIEIGCGKIWKMPRGPKGEKRPADVARRLTGWRKPDAEALIRDHGAEAHSKARQRERDVIPPDRTAARQG